VSAEISPVTISPEQLLALTGRLDDAPGFDTPRERFRRFLIERVNDMPLVRALVEHWEHATGEQHQRALQDAVVALGRFLGFEASFGSYRPAPGTVRYDGHWRSRHRLHVILEVRTYHTPRADLESLSRSLAALSTVSHVDADRRRLGLCVVSALHAGRAALEDVIAQKDPDSDIRVVSTRTLLSLGDMVSRGRLTHEELLKLLQSSSSLDFLVGLLERGVADRASVSEAHARSGCWVAAVGSDGTASAERIVQLLIGRRHIVGVTNAPGVKDVPAPDDRICFFVAGAGVMGHGDIASIAEEGEYLVRDSERFSHVLRLKNVVLYEGPLKPAAEQEERLVGALQAGGTAAGSILAAISRNEFAGLTTPEPEAASDRTSRSHESVHPIGPRPTHGVRRTADGGT
jgi:hypothetical protein